MFAGTLRTAVDNLWEAFWTGGLGHPPPRLDNDPQPLLRRPPEHGPDPKHKDLCRSSYKDKDPDTLFALSNRPDARLDDLNVFDYMKRPCASSRSASAARNTGWGTSSATGWRGGSAGRAMGLQCSGARSSADRPSPTNERGSDFYVGTPTGFHVDPDPFHVVM